MLRTTCFNYFSVSILSLNNVVYYEPYTTVDSVGITNNYAYLALTKIYFYRIYFVWHFNNS